MKTSLFAVLKRRIGLLGMAVFLLPLLAVSPCRADEALVAVAANFLEPMQVLQKAFEAKTGHTLKLSSGATGAFYTQIKNDAPFDVFLAADHERPRLLVAGSLAEGRFTYAIGKLVLWSADPDFIKGDAKALLEEDDAFKYLAIANPVTAPYGAAAQQTLQNLGLWDTLSPKLVRGQDLAQTFQFVSTRNAQLGFVAMSQALSETGKSGSRWEVPDSLHEPILQDAVLLKHGNGNTVAIAFMEFLHSAQAQDVIKSFGYEIMP
jgi:molybdate transport system substrate-binding protein